MQQSVEKTTESKTSSLKKSSHYKISKENLSRETKKYHLTGHASNAHSRKSGESNSSTKMARKQEAHAIKQSSGKNRYRKILDKVDDQFNLP